MDLLKWINIALGLFLIMSILRMEYVLEMGRVKIRQIDETYGVQDDKRYEKVWEVGSKCMTIARYWQLTSLLILLILFNWHPVFLKLTIFWEIISINKMLRKMSEDITHHSEKAHFTKKRKRNTSNTKDPEHHIASKVWEDVSPIYNRAKWICIIIGTAFVLLSIILNRMRMG